MSTDTSDGPVTEEIGGKLSELDLGVENGNSSSLLAKSDEKALVNTENTAEGPGDENTELEDGSSDETNVIVPVRTRRKHHDEGTVHLAFHNIDLSNFRI